MPGEARCADFSMGGRRYGSSMRSLVVLVVLAGSLAALAILTVPTDHGRVALAGQVGDHKAECLISQVNDNWPRRILGPWAIKQTAGSDTRYEVFGAFGQSWEFWRSEGTLSTTGVRSIHDFGTSSCS